MHDGLSNAGLLTLDPQLTRYSHGSIKETDWNQTLQETKEPQLELDPVQLQTQELTLDLD